MKISEILRKAKPFLEKSEYVCFAIDDCGISEKDKEKAKKYIADLIAPFGEVNTWLYHKDISGKDLTFDNMLDYRKRWIDHMISELEKEGK